MDEIPVKAGTGGHANLEPTSSRGRSHSASPQAGDSVRSARPFGLSREQAIRELETFHALTHMLADCNNDVERISQCIARVTAQSMGDTSAILLLEDRRETYRLAAIHDEQPEALALLGRLVEEVADSPDGRSMVDGLISSGEPVFLPAVPLERFSSIPLPTVQEYVHRIGITSLMIMPMLGRSGAVGAVLAWRQRGSRAYTEVDRHFLDQVAFTAGRAIESAILVRTLRREVSARLLATRALADSEKRFLSIFHASPLGITVMERVGTLLETNASFQNISGYAENDLIAMRLQDIVHAEDAGKLLEVFRRLVNSRDSRARLEHRIVRSDGSIIWVETTFAVVRKTGADQEPELIFGITEDFTERRKADAELLELKQHLQHSIELERLRLAQNLHEAPLQELYAVIYRLEELRLGVDAANSALLATVIDDIQKTLTTLRATASELRPPALSRFGLEKAIRSYMQEFEERHPGIQVELLLARDGQSVPESVRLVLFRVLQEAVANAAHHAQASHIRVSFAFDAEEARLDITDNGRGFVVPGSWMTVVRAGHYGLARMSERVTAAGGTLEVESAPGESTAIRVTIPCVNL